jgi:hypothetical protein
VLYAVHVRIYRVAFRSSENEVDVVNVFHVGAHMDAPDWTRPHPASPSPADVAGEIESHLVTKYRAMLADSATLHDITVQDEVDPANPGDAREAHVTTVELAGTRSVSFENAPPAICAVATLTTANIGRSFRGRFFAPPLMNNSDLTNGVIDDTSAYLVAIRAFADELRQELGGGSAWTSLWMDTWHMQFGVYSRTRRAHDFSPYFSRITGFNVKRTPHWLRSREAGHR